MQSTDPHVLQQQLRAARRGQRVLGGIAAIVLVSWPLFVWGGPAVNPFPTYSVGDPIRSDDFNVGLQALVDTVNERTLVYEGGVPVSTRSGTYCGATTSRSPNVGGYPAVKGLCEEQCGELAHACNAAEISLSAQLGFTIPDGWISTGQNSVEPSDGNKIRDCLGWTNATDDERGMIWFQDDKHPSNTLCGGQRPFLCCK